MENCPIHVAIIMDGNGRWAQKRNLPRSAGHYAGVDNVRNIAIKANELGVKYLTVYAFSTENWNRPAEEVSYLMSLPAMFFKKFLKELMEKDIKITAIGDLEAFPKATKNVLLKAIDETKNNKKMVLNFAMNYGSKAEIVAATKKIAQDYQQAKISLDEINNDLFSQYLYTHEMPDVDFLIRTSGEYRLSNFMLWQLAYAEFYFTDTNWPDFSGEELEKAISLFTKRDRRYGGVK